MTLLKQLKKERHNFVQNHVLNQSGLNHGLVVERGLVLLLQAKARAGSRDSLGIHREYLRLC